MISHSNKEQQELNRNTYYEEMFYNISKKYGLYIIIYPPFDNFKETEFKASIVTKNNPFISFTNNEWVKDEDLIRLKEKILYKLLNIIQMEKPMTNGVKVLNNNTNGTSINVPTDYYITSNTFTSKPTYSEPKVIKVETTRNKIEITYRKQLINSNGIQNLQDVHIYKHTYFLASPVPEIEVAEVMPPQDEYYIFR
jgi:hypothetical protein